MIIILKKDYVIEYAYVLEEPNYNTLNNYIIYTDDTFGNIIEDEENYYQKYEYIGKSSDFTVIISDNIINNCNNDLCSLCFTNYICITCNYNYDFIDNNKICLPNPPTTIITTIPATIFATIPKTIFTTIPFFTSIPSNSEYRDCSNKQILENKCKGKMTNEQIGEIYNILKKYNISSNTDEIIETMNVKFQITTLDKQKNNNLNISSIDLGKCEELLKKQEGLSEEHNLIILKTDIKNEDLSKIYVQYEIYNPINLQLISTKICRVLPISISVPCELDENTKSIYTSLSQSGYNLFNLNDSFYNDICTTYTTEYGTDLTLADRKNIIYDNNGNISLCQEKCTFQSYDLINKKAKCNCDIQVELTITNISKINFKNELYNSFLIL